MAFIISASCIGCESCIPRCSYGAIDINDEGKLVINREKCNECGECLQACPVEAIDSPSGNRKGKTTDKIDGKHAEKSSSGSSGNNKLQTDIKKQNNTASETPIGKAATIPVPEKTCGSEENNAGIWVFTEHIEGKIASVTLELIGAAKKLAQKLDVPVSAILIGEHVESIAPVLFEYGADKVYLIDDPVFHHYRVETYSSSFCYLVEKYKPNILLIGATTTGRDLAGSMATRLRTGLTADCTGLEIDNDKKILLASRPAFGGNIMATIVCESHRPQMATVRPKVMQMLTPEACRTGELIRERFEIDEEDLRTKIIKIVKEQAENIKLEDAKIIVCGGRGIQDENGYKILHDFANVLGGVVAGSRGAVEKGLIDYKQQVGQTGHTVAPKLYFAIGVSGAIQHVVGMQGSEVVVAVNTDSNCPMMKLATYGIMGDASVILPILIEEFKKLLDTIPEASISDLCSIVEEDVKIV